MNNADPEAVTAASRVDDGGPAAADGAGQEIRQAAVVLDRIVDTDVEEHVEVYRDLHHRLQNALDAADARSGGG